NASFSDIALLYLQNYIRTLAEYSLLILLEDLHWMDDLTLDLLTDLVSESRADGKTQMMILCTSRSQFFEWHPKWGEGITGFNKLKLRKLSRLQCRLLIDEVLFRIEDIPEAFYKRILDQAGGNPFFIEELIKMLIEEGVIEADDGPWRIRLEKLADVQVPSTLSGILQARLDSLPLPERKVVQRAAIIGRTFWDNLLRALTENEDEEQRINARLTALRERGLIFPSEHSSIAGSQEYLFKHALLCNEAYGTVLLKHRRTYHRKVAVWIEENAGDRLEEHLALIASHYFEGGQPELAADWFIQAGERALSQCSMQEAKIFFERALKLIGEEDSMRIWRATLGHDEAVGTLGELEVRHADDIALLNLAQHLKNDAWLAEAYFRIGSQAKSEGNHQASMCAFNQALEAANRKGDFSMQALILPMQVTIFTADGDLKAADKLVDRALKLAHETGDADILARALTNLAPYYQAIGDLTQSVQLMHQQVEITQQQGNRLGEAFGLINLGYFYLSLGHFETSHSLLECALKISRRLGARSCIAYSLLNLGLAEWRLGQTETACQTLQLSLEKLESLGDHGGLASRQFYLGLAYESTNDISEATRHFTAALDGFKLLNATSQIVEVQAALARLTLQTGDKVQAEQYALQIIHYLDQEGPQGLELPILVYMSCARIFKVLEDTTLLQHTLQSGHREIQDRLTMISDVNWRKIFLEAIPENRELLKEYEYGS
ncbi:MAG: ATP-binding protein, partial [Candidatus Thorarchaeota archaeon]